MKAFNFDAVQTLLPKFDRKFFYSWISCSTLMFLAFYAWHGLMLSDFVRLHIPLAAFLSIASVVYLFVGLVVTVLTYVLKRIKDSFKYGIAVGAAIGVLLYAAAFVVGIGFTQQPKLHIVLFDLGWQVAEQSLGGLVCGWVYRIMWMAERSERVAG